MTYELAKQLKDGGFKDRYDHAGEVREPSLSEIIEACGDGFTVLLFDKKLGVG